MIRAGLFATELFFVESGAVVGFEEIESFLELLQCRRVDVLGERPFLIGEAGPGEDELDGAESNRGRRFGGGQKQFQLVKRGDGDTPELAGQALAVFFLRAKHRFGESRDVVFPTVDGVAVDVSRPGRIDLRCAGGQRLQDALLHRGEAGWIGIGRSDVFDVFDRSDRFGASGGAAGDGRVCAGVGDADAFHGFGAHVYSLRNGIGMRKARALARAHP